MKSISRKLDLEQQIKVVEGHILMREAEMTKLAKDIGELEKSLKKLRKDLKKETLFSETGFGRGYYATVRALTSPFASAHQAASAELQDPRKVLVHTESSKLLQRTQFVLEACNRMKEGHEDANSMAKEAAKMVMTIEAYMEKHSDEADSNLELLLAQLAPLDRQVQRLRTVPRDEESIQDVKDKIDELVQAIAPEVVQVQEVQPEA